MKKQLTGLCQLCEVTKAIFARISKEFVMSMPEIITKTIRFSLTAEANRDALLETMHRCRAYIGVCAHISVIHAPVLASAQS